jgi:dTDP-glucose pyrophosphorylase
MKALILAGGRGNRLEQITDEVNKCMLRMAGKPLIEYSLENARVAGVDEIIIVVGYLAEDIINTYGNRYRDVPIRYVIQWEQKGLVHAIECSRKSIGDSDFMLFLADEILVNPKHGEMIKKFSSESIFVLCGVITVEDSSQISKTYAIIKNESNNQIFRMIEKPARPMNDIMGTGNCIFSNRIFEYIPETPINQKRGEKELPDLIQCAIDNGRMVKAFFIGDKYFNINTPDDIRIAESDIRR